MQFPDLIRILRQPYTSLMNAAQSHSLFAIQPLSIRLIGGFAQAVTFAPETFAALNEGSG